MVRNYNQYHCKINNFRISPTGELKGWDRFCNVAVKSRLEQTNQKKEKIMKTISILPECTCRGGGGS